MTDQGLTEQALRQLWTARGVPVDRQDAMIEQIKNAARPGARVGPFRLPYDSQSQILDTP